VATFKNEAVATICTGNSTRAEWQQRRAFDADLATARRAQDVANKRLLTAAKTRADLGQLNLAQLRYAAAAEDFQQAANLVPAGGALVRSGYLNSAGLAAGRAANYPLASTTLAEALAIRERLLDPEHPDVAVSLNNLALLLQDTNRLSEAEPLSRRALAISEKSYGPDHPDVATGLNNLASLLQDTNRLSEAEPLYRRALAIAEKSYGPHHPTTETIRRNLRSGRDEFGGSSGAPTDAQPQAPK